MKIDSTTRVFVTLGLAIEALLVATLRLGDLGQNVPRAVLVQMLIATLYIAGSFFVLRPSEDKRLYRGVILGFAVVFRLTVWPLYPTLTDDVYRYRWEGMLQAAGGNPYEARPADSRWISLRDETFERVVGRDFKAGYGPLTEAVELGTYRLVNQITSDPWGQVFWFKLPAAFFDLLTIGALLAFLRAAKLPSRRLLIYAWSPVPLIEFWANGHNDAIALFWLVLALTAASRDRWAWALLWLAMASAVKVWPLALFPLFMADSLRRRVNPLAVSAPAVFAIMALAAPYWTDISENMRHVSGFVGGWRNNDGLFGLTLLLSNDLYRAKYVTFGVISLVIAGMSMMRWRLTARAVIVIVAILAFSANCHPWYTTWFLPLLVVEPFVPLFLWSGLMPIAYSVVTEWRSLGEWNGLTPTRWYIHGPFYALLVAYAIRAVRYNRGRCDWREYRPIEWTHTSERLGS